MCVCQPLGRVRKLARPSVAAQLRDRTVRRVQAGTTRQEHDRWIEKRRQQHRVYWPKAINGRHYEPFTTEAQARAFVALCKQFGRDKVVARHRARGLGQAPTVLSPRPPRTPTPSRSPSWPLV
jgi:hypothetical protein